MKRGFQENLGGLLLGGIIIMAVLCMAIPFIYLLDWMNRVPAEQSGIVTRVTEKRVTLRSESGYHWTLEMRPELKDVQKGQTVTVTWYRGALTGVILSMEVKVQPMREVLP